MERRLNLFRPRELAAPDAVAGDPLVAAALDAARRSYAPYTGNVAGATLELGTAVERGVLVEAVADRFQVGSARKLLGAMVPGVELAVVPVAPT